MATINDIGIPGMYAGGLPLVHTCAMCYEMFSSTERGSFCPDCMEYVEMLSSQPCYGADKQVIWECEMYFLSCEKKRLKAQEDSQNNRT